MGEAALHYGDGHTLTAPATDDARTWQGWGTALKPAFEPVIVARKPLVGSVAANVLAYGTGALNIDGCRIDMGAEYDPAKRQRQQRSDGTVRFASEGLIGSDIPTYNPAGRWPANVILDESQAAALDEMSGTLASPAPYIRSTKADSGIYGNGATAAQVGQRVNAYGDQGGASRFFYVAKADRAERPSYVKPDGTRVAHPTVKPLDLMRQLVRLVTPPNGTVLDPFAGSGATVEAAILEGFKVVAVEKTEDYLPLIDIRIARAKAPHTLTAHTEREVLGQLGLFEEGIA